MAIRLTPFSARSFRINKGVVSRDYHFKMGEWTEVDNPADLWYLLSGAKAVLREERPLGKMAVACFHAGETAYVPYNDGPSEKRLAISGRGAVSILDAHVAKYLLARGIVEIVPIAQALAARPNARVLLTRPGGIGDVLLSTPAVMELARRFPRAQLTYQTSTPNVRLVQHCPGVVQAVGMDQAYQDAPYDLVCDLTTWVEAHPQQNQHRIDLFAQALGVEISDYRMHGVVTEEEQAAAANWLAPARETGKPMVAMQVTNGNWRRIPSPGKLAKIGTVLWEAGYCPVYLGNEQRKAFGDPAPAKDYWDLWPGTNLTCRLSVGELFGVMNAVDASVVGDSGLLHIANALQLPVVGLFGPVDPSVRVKDCPRCIPIRSNDNIRCGPCNDHQLRACAPPAACLESIPEDQIVEAVERALCA